MAVLFLVMQVGGICLISDPAFLSSDCHRVLQQTQRGTIAVISRFSPATTYIAGLFLAWKLLHLPIFLLI